MPESRRVRVCAVAELAPGAARRVILADRDPIAVFNVDGSFYVTDDDCTHGLSSLAKDGQVIGHEVECGWHGGRFNILTGRATGAPCVKSLRTYAIEVVDGAVYAFLS
jgi:nitrite reductase/ring-hydroxylating ferredoxin subunit